MRDKLIKIFLDRPSPKIGADRVLSLLAPELEKAEKWDKVVRIVTYADIKPCDGCPLINVDVCNWLCDYAVKVVEALEGGERCQQLKIYE